MERDPDYEFLLWLAMEMGRTPRELEASLTPGEFEDLKVFQNRKAARQDLESKKARQRASRKRSR